MYAYGGYYTAPAQLCRWDNLGCRARSPLPGWSSASASCFWETGSRRRPSRLGVVTGMSAETVGKRLNSIREALQEATR